MIKEKTRKIKTVRGSVLFTTVSVLALLIIFLTGALALASSANNRAHRSYSSSQASYNARAAIDAFTQAMIQDPNVAAAVHDMKSDESLQPVLSIGNKDDALGSWTRDTSNGWGTIGYYDEDGDFQEGMIDVRPTGNSNEYGWNEAKSAWQKLTEFKITATARYGKEEETLVAYVKTVVDQKSNDSLIRGLQTAGGAVFGTTASHYTGDVVLGATEDGTTTYSVNNGSTFDTVLNFINGNLTVSGSGLNINVNDKSCQTVINGNFSIQNSTLVNVNYVVNSNYTQQTIPCLFINGGAYFPNQIKLVEQSKSEKAPYNVFVGTLRSQQNNFDMNGVDLYLMDTYEPAVKYEVEYGNDIIEISKGANQVGYTSSKLEKWASSTFNKTEQQFHSEGGSIYCNGNLTLKSADINGDVRVRGDAFIQDGKISGKLIVGGTLYISGNPTVTGGVYCNNVKNSTGDLTIQGYTEVSCFYHPRTQVNLSDYETYECGKLYYYKWAAEEHRIQDESTWQYVLYDPWGEQISDAWQDVYYAWNTTYMPGDDISTPELLAAALDPDSVYKQWQRPQNPIDYSSDYYYVMPTTIVDEAGETIVVDSGIPTNEPYYYYNPTTGAFITEDSTWVEAYYTKPVFDGTDYVDSLVQTNKEKIWFDQYGNEVADIASKSNDYSGSLIVKPLSDSGLTTDTVYPQTMTREAIYGSVDDMGNFSAAPAGTKIVRTLKEVQDALNCDSTGTFDASIYPDTCTEVIDKEVNVGDPSDKLSKVGSGDYSNYYKIDENIKLTGSGDNDFYIDSSDGDIWVEISDNVTFNNNHRIIVKQGTGNDVYFFIDKNKKIYFNGGGIITDTCKEGVTFAYNTKSSNITIFGADGSKIDGMNNYMIMASVKAPHTTISTATATGSISIYYKDEFGSNPITMNPAFIGNVLCKGVEGSNNFTLAYTDAGAGSSGNVGSQTIYSAIGDRYELSYYAAS